ncbi:MAG: nuclear transport factor 2 family protein [Sporichthyaceae bacterium]
MPDMPSEVDVALALYPALRSWDRGALDALLAPDFHGRTTAGMPFGGTFDGPEAMLRAFWGRIGRTFAVVAEPREALALGDGRVLVLGTYRGHARGVGREFEAEFSHVLTIFGAQITAVDQLTDSAAWNAALDPASAPTGSPA